MSPLTNQQALANLKELADEAVRRGFFQNCASVVAVVLSLEQLGKLLEDQSPQP